MAKYGAYGATLGMGTRQVETATVVGVITLAGDAHVVVTAAGMAGSPETVVVDVLLGDVATVIAEKIRAHLILNANVFAWFEVGGSGTLVQLTRRLAEAVDATMNIDVHNDTCTGITDDNTSDTTVAGLANANIAYIKSISGPPLSLDVEDVTTHDSAEAWEEVVATILRTGEISLELVYDPNAVTHSAVAGGLLDYVENKKIAYFLLTFVAGFVWMFPAYVVSVEPSAPVEGALTESVSLKISGKPIIV